MKKAHTKEIVGVAVGIFAILTIMVVSKPEFLQGNLRLSQLTTKPGQERVDTSTKEKDLTTVPTIKVVAGSNSVTEGINSVMATAIENEADVKLVAATMQLTIKDLTVSNLRLMLNGKDITSALDKESQATLAKELTTLTQSTLSKELTLTSLTGIDVSAGNNRLELQGTYKGTKTTSTLTTSLRSMTFSKDGVKTTVTPTM